MAAPLKLDEIFEDRPQPALSGKALEELAAQIATDRQRPDIERLTRQLEDYERTVTDAGIRLNQIVEMAADAAEEVLDQAIDDLGRREKHSYRALRPQIEHSRKMLASLHRQPTAYRVNFGVLHHRYLNAIIQDLEQMRDARWQLMAIRADRYPSEPIGPVHGRSTDLRKHLSTVS